MPRGNEQHIHLMGLTFNQCTYLPSPTCLKKQPTGELGKLPVFLCACVCVSVPVGGPTDC